jgi:glycosyltransferase involved in cell wall biosynthesis
MRFLPEFGWDVTTITPDLHNGGPNGSQYIRTGYWDVKGSVKRVFGINGRSTHEVFNVEVPKYGERKLAVQRLIAGAASLVTYPDDCVGWLPFAAAAIRKAASQGPWDAMLSTAPPMTTNLAVRFARTQIPWIADFRDLWAESDYSERSILQALFDDPLERFSLAPAAALTASSGISAERLQNRYPAKPCYAVSTGYDAEDWKDIPFSGEPVCTILYAGQLYRGKRDPTLLFSSLRRIFDRGLAVPGDIRVDFYTAAQPWLLQSIAQFGLQEVVRICGVMDRKTVLAAERRADRLLVLCWDGLGADGIVPGKVFEYFGARRPILALGGAKRSAVEQLLQETGAGVRCLSEDHVTAEILAALREHRNTRRIIAEDAVSRYSGRNCAARFAQILASITETAAPSAYPANTQK